ncbi:putative methyltransferase-domain-containing protein [Hygrophoropsis aurantiaca]|uniref:Methyltransferase-domain-containing protein n=1 Tax=Hygrophoropsis aurantiaca TaxID=72124 RepID=A0ACB8ATZ8_9AGAM|nr:putative methyltransferase-domain-containing protein [Hygrophoropsis aurantiaca]
MDESNCQNEIAQDEALDTIDPLRHFRTGKDGFDMHIEETDIIPHQPRSVQDEVLRLSFPQSPALASAQQVSISLRVDASPGCGGIAWPAGEVLSNYIAMRGRDYIKGRQILELGSGTGLVGLVAGALGGKVQITDQAPLLGIMQRNVEMNGLQASVAVSELNWGEKLSSEISQPDLILAADCVYFEPAFPLLVQTLWDLAHCEKTEILFCYKKRRKADKHFFALLKKKFTWKEVADDPSRHIYTREAISLLTLSSRS